jgi:hypothetical protein
MIDGHPHQDNRPLFTVDSLLEAHSLWKFTIKVPNSYPILSGIQFVKVH